MLNSLQLFYVSIFSDFESLIKKVGSPLIIYIYFHEDIFYSCNEQTRKKNSITYFLFQIFFKKKTFSFILNCEHPSLSL